MRMYFWILAIFICLGTVCLKSRTVQAQICSLAYLESLSDEEKQAIRAEEVNVHAPCNDNGETIADFVVLNSRVDLLQTLIELGVDLGQTQIFPDFESAMDGMPDPLIHIKNADTITPPLDSPFSRTTSYSLSSHQPCCRRVLFSSG